MSVKLVAFDMDGTVLTSDKRLPDGLFDEDAPPACGRRILRRGDGSLLGHRGRDVRPGRRHHVLRGVQWARDRSRRPRAHSLRVQLGDGARLERVRRGVRCMVPVFFTSSRGFALASPEAWHPIAASEYGPTDLLDEPDLSEDVIKVSVLQASGHRGVPRPPRGARRGARAGCRLRPDLSVDDRLLPGRHEQGARPFDLARDMGIGMDEVMAMRSHERLRDGRRGGVRRGGAQRH